jgi:thioredoxin-like negative regulator of GroEL
MESLLAHIERKERGHLDVRRVDADERPDLVAKFRVTQIPALTLVVHKKVVARLEGRSTVPKIESMLEANLEHTAAL